MKLDHWGIEKIVKTRHYCQSYKGAVLVWPFDDFIGECIGCKTWTAPLGKYVYL